MSNRQNLSNWLQTELHNRDWSQSELARVSGLHRAIISKIILQGSDPTPETLPSTNALPTTLKKPASCCNIFHSGQQRKTRWSSMACSPASAIKSSSRLTVKSQSTFNNKSNEPHSRLCGSLHSVFYT